MSEKVTPGDGSCMFHAILDQIQSIPELQDYASSHFELRWKIVSDGYKMFLETDKLSWPDDPSCGSKILERMEDWDVGSDNLGQTGGSRTCL